MSKVNRLTLNGFRCYTEASLETTAKLVVLTGENGVGKTNILEGLSLFSQGRGLRRATLSEMVNEQAQNGFSLHLKLEKDRDTHSLGTGLEAGSETRSYRYEGSPASIHDFSELIRVLWLTPQMDGLFNGASSERRRFLDRLVLAIDKEHGSRVNALEKLLRSRNKILEENGNKKWLDAVEHELSQVSVAVAFARAECVAHLQPHLAHDNTPFPHAILTLAGLLEAECGVLPALTLEENYRKMLYTNRGRDRAAGRTLEGAHKTDLIVTHAPTKTLAERCSTGQQKALLIGLILAHAKLVNSMAGFPPIILLDEVVAHLDPIKRKALFDVLEKLDAQVFMTGADDSAFSELQGNAEHFKVEMGKITRCQITGTAPLRA